MDSGFISHTEEQQKWNDIQLTGEIPIASTRYFHLAKVKIGLKWYVKKTVKPELKSNSFFNQLLKKEFEIGQQLNHPCIAAYHFYGSHDGSDYVITDFIEGATINEYLKDNEVSSKTKKETFKNFINDLCGALHYLHSKGIVHGDLSPKNIIYSAQLKKFILIDFGHAFFPGYVSLAGGTADFSAPELSLPNESIHSSADVYSFGKLLQAFSDSCNFSSYEKIIKACCSHEAQSRPKSIAVVQEMLHDHAKSNIIKKTAVALLFVFFGLLVFYFSRSSEYQPSTHKSDKMTKNEVPIKQVNHSDTSINPQPKKSFPKTKPAFNLESDNDTILQQFDFLPEFQKLIYDKKDNKNIINIRTSIVLKYNRLFEDFINNSELNSVKIDALKKQYFSIYYKNFRISDSLIAEQLNIILK